MPKTKLDQRIIIKFLVKSGEKPSVILTKLREVYGTDTLTKSRVYDWVKDFKCGRETIEDEDRDGAPPKVCNSENVARLRELIRANSWMSIRMLALELGVNRTSIWNMLHNDLHLRKIHLRFVPKLLTPEQRLLRESICRDFLDRTASQGTEWMDNVVIGGEICLARFDSETFQTCSKLELGEISDKQTTRTQINVKTTLVCFFDSKGVIHFEFVPEDGKVNGPYYVSALEKLCSALTWARPQLGIKGQGWMLQHDVVPAHLTLDVQEFLVKKGVTVLPHPANSPDISPCDFFLSLQMRKKLYSRNFDSVRSLEEFTIDVLEKLPAEEFRGCFERWRTHWTKCVEAKGDYLEET